MPNYVGAFLIRQRWRILDARGARLVKRRLRRFIGVFVPVLLVRIPACRGPSRLDTD
jgi:hypothetical protein